MGAQPQMVAPRAYVSRFSSPGITPVTGRPRVRMLLSSAGRRVGLLRCFRSDARLLGADLEIYATDIAPEWSAACLEADHPLAVPPAESDEFIPLLLTLCQRNEITLLVPTIDTELVLLSNARERFKAIGTTVAIADPALVGMARDKLATAQFLAAAGLPTPATAAAEAVLRGEGDWAWPLLAKPRHGSSSRGVQVVENRAALEVLALREPYVAQEILRGKEYTVSLYFDPGGALICAVPHERVKVRAGEVEKGVTSRHPGLCRLGRDLGAHLNGAFGAMCFQAFLSDDDQASIFEINARFGGGYPLIHRAGATFTRWLLEQALGRESSAHDRWHSGAVMLRFDDAIFV
jgi:carbamoyl-phosphate synthase large subunit